MHMLWQEQKEIIPWDQLTAAGLEQTQRFLDLIAVKKLSIATLDHPEKQRIAIFKSDNETILKHYIVFQLAIKPNITIYNTRTCR